MPGEITVQTRRRAFRVTSDHEVGEVVPCVAVGKGVRVADAVERLAPTQSLQERRRRREPPRLGILSHDGCRRGARRLRGVYLACVGRPYVQRGAARQWQALLDREEKQPGDDQGQQRVIQCAHLRSRRRLHRLDAREGDEGRDKKKMRSCRGLSVRRAFGVLDAPPWVRRDFIVIEQKLMGLRGKCVRSLTVHRRLKVVPRPSEGSERRSPSTPRGGSSEGGGR